MLKALLLFSLCLAARAARSCESIAFQWTVSEFTYDAPDSTAVGRGAIDAFVGLYLKTGGADYSCYGSWLDAWGGRVDRGKDLIWYHCINSKGRAVDETVSFAIDWKNRTLDAAHTYLCNGGSNTNLPWVATGSVALDLDCDALDALGSPTRCLTQRRRFDLLTHPESPPAVTEPPQRSNLTATPSWEVTEYSQLSAPAEPRLSESVLPGATLFILRDMGGPVTLNCTRANFTGSHPTAGTIAGSCSAAAPPLEKIALPVTFRIEMDLKLLEVTQSLECQGPSTRNWFVTPVTP
ncbi:hypothetical protein B0H67DRAFT_558546 [Lasiosphaeris hirsuta]|uniref:Uncharacterized protein n=1 Tax=Lasiosphaeris hirsuta TaxID=260670 RepID=A0AA39ZRN3_9PEZI|nr:hypothetical protein B0H67DRAFT_558546 [Lasiosphaeris hirsuta]